MKLIERVNMSKKRVKKGLFPLTYKNDGWRIVFPKSLEFYDFLPAGRKLLELSVYCLLYTSPSPRDRQKSRMPSSA